MEYVDSEPYQQLLKMSIVTGVSPIWFGRELSNFHTVVGDSRADALWPQELPLLVPRTTPVDLMLGKEFVPHSLEKLMEWAYVRRIYNNDPRRRYVLVYSPTPDTDGTVERVCIRFQGFVQNTDMRPLGNWNGCVITQ